MQAWVEGVKDLLEPFMVLWLAWALGEALQVRSYCCGWYNTHVLPVAVPYWSVCGVLLGHPNYQLPGQGFVRGWRGLPLHPSLGHHHWLHDVLRCRIGEIITVYVFFALRLEKRISNFSFNQ